MIYNHIIYKLTFPNGKFYIGQTNDFNGRMNDYKNLNKSIGRFIKNAIRKYRWENVKKEIICTASEEFIDDVERYFIKLYKSNNKLFGYNLENGGHKNKIVSEETKKLMRQSHLGKKPTDKTRKIWSEQRSGKNNPNYDKDGYWKGKKNFKISGENHYLWNKHHTEETKEKIRQSHLGKESHWKGKKQTIEHNQKRAMAIQKSIDVYTKSGEFFKTFNSIKCAGIELKLDISNIVKVLKNKYKYTGNYIFKYSEK